MEIEGILAEGVLGPDAFSVLISTLAHCKIRRDGITSLGPYTSLLALTPVLIEVD